MIIVVMGVAGSGKTTVGRELARALECAFLDGDALHPDENVEKMSRGIPLTDSDRAWWLSAVHQRMRDAHAGGQSLVVACSALRQSYRSALAEGLPVTWVYLEGPAEVIRARLSQRDGHFMKADMLPSQFEALEEPSDAIVIDVSPPPASIVMRILRELRNSTPVPSAPAPARTKPAT